MKNGTTLISLTSLVLLASSFTQVPAQSIQKWVDAEGKTHYGVQPPKEAQSKSIKAPPAGNPSQAFVADQVTLYSTSWCGYCKKARAYLQRNDIEFTELDIEKDRFAKAAYDRAGGAGIPFLVKGENILRGFRASSYDRFFSSK